MKNDKVSKRDKQDKAPIVIADECGDSMWDAVLGQEVKACQISEVLYNPDILINKTGTVQAVENDNAR